MGRAVGADVGRVQHTEGAGGDQATVTDANLVLGHLRADRFLGGRMRLDPEAALAAVERIARQLDMDTLDTARGIVQVANEKMIQALRVISVQRGHDPAEFQLTCFGGAGGLHVCALADALGVSRILIPSRGGVLSALGMLVASPGRDLSRTFTTLLTEAETRRIEALFDDLETQGRDELAAEGIAPAAIACERSLDLRYQGQTHTLNLPWLGADGSIQAFHEKHRRQYGHELPQPVELVNVRASLIAGQPDIELPALTFSGIRGQPEALRLPGSTLITALYEREQLGLDARVQGPCLITETHATTLLTAGWEAHMDTTGNLLARRAP